jgi:hypothetical protein
MNIPNDPVMLLSCINMMLRDKYSDFNSLCNSEDLNASEITEKLAKIGYSYNESINQFR